MDRGRTPGDRHGHRGLGSMASRSASSDPRTDALPGRRRNRRGAAAAFGSDLLYRDEVSPRRAPDAAALAAFLPYVEVVDFSDDAALHSAGIRTISRNVAP